MNPARSRPPVLANLNSRLSHKKSKQNDEGSLSVEPFRDIPIWRF